MKQNSFTDITEFINYIQTRKRFSKKTSLDKMRYLSKLFDNPQDKFLSIHVGGTNGKGSTVTLLKNIYEERGLHVATFTSPYVIKFNERITFDGEFISDEDLLKYGNLIISKYDEIESAGYELPTFFEFITLLAFLYFSELKNLDLAIIEVGIGGRLDATNIITPIASVITNVAFDHMNQLGNTLELICKEKLGIVKENVPFITGNKNPSLDLIMEEVTANLNAPYTKVDSEQIRLKYVDLDQTVFSYKDISDITSTNLVGFHQIENIATAIEVVKACNNLAISRKRHFDISCEILKRGILKAYWPGRFEKVNEKPLIYIDGGHNIDCITRVTDFIKTLSFNHKRAVVSISADKDYLPMIKKIDETFDEVIFTSYTYSRSERAIELFNKSNITDKKIIDSPKDAVNYCLNNECDFTIFIGSLYLVSEVRPLFIKEIKK